MGLRMTGKSLYCKLPLLLLTFAFALVFSRTSFSSEFPRIGGLLKTKKEEFLQSSSTKWLVASDLVVIGPRPGAEQVQYIDRIAQIKDFNPNILFMRYINVTAINREWGAWQGAVDSLNDYFVNPNRGGSNTANDGWARYASGEIPTPYAANSSINIMDYVDPYNGSKGQASTDSDLSKPRINERPVDYMGRHNYFTRLETIEDVLDGVYEDVNRRWPKVRADWNNDGSNDGKNEYSSPLIQRKWREAMMHSRDNMVGPNFDGRNAPRARGNGRAWLSQGGYYLVNGSAWILGQEVRDRLNLGKPIPKISEYDQELHGGNHEAIFGLEHSRGGLLPDGTATRYSTKSKGLDAALTSFQYSYSHAKEIPELGHAAFIFSAHATNLDMARYSFAAGLMSDGLVAIFNNTDGLSYAPWFLDEYVGEDYKSLSNRQIDSNSKWLGQAIDPAYPNNPRSNNQRVFMREFENGLVVVLAGRSHLDDHMTETEVVRLPDPGNGYVWQRISGGQDPNWNDGSDVGPTIKLGSSHASIRQNAIILRREMKSDTQITAVPKPPGLQIQ